MLKTDTLKFASRFKRAIPAAEKFTGKSETPDNTICALLMDRMIARREELENGGLGADAMTAEHDFDEAA